ncbi:hypothetical protein [Pseudorhizobium pelagicum]|uniref:Cell wall anchor protein n=1 Tax=Pseudorhizobium pelagicum TaxID=1509405 RepID=A0A922P093_9HYPH|nr:hypothetical protein [Pseudorhizobium pelagicum]KEQ05764.1 hypothetical protein GV67_04250 [Pseudorhizobium pelagicum]KEQ06443.1 hypothetical protein GV68_07245 [Pseudorhizobium pelagicum]
MKRTAILAAAAVALSACTSLEGALDNSVPATCRVADTTYAAFVIASTAGEWPERTVTRVEAAYASLSAICDSPEGIKAEDLPLIVANAYANFIKATRDARAVAKD